MSAAETKAGLGGWQARVPPFPVLGLIAATVIGFGLFLWAQRDAFVVVAQRGILFEQPREPTEPGAVVNEIDASVAWEAVAGGADGPEIVANLDVPGTGQRVRLTFRKNTDATLPATHVVEMDASPQTDFPDKEIVDMGGLIAKATPDEAGVPLIAASAKIADRVFWLGLSSAGTDVVTNLGLLGSANFFDLPLTYQSGQRATITFEKGRTGRPVFQKVLAAW